MKYFVSNFVCFFFLFLLNHFKFWTKLFKEFFSYFHDSMKTYAFDMKSVRVEYNMNYKKKKLSSHKLRAILISHRFYYGVNSNSLFRFVVLSHDLYSSFYLYALYTGYFYRIKNVENLVQMSRKKFTRWIDFRSNKSWTINV